MAHRLDILWKYNDVKETMTARAAFTWCDVAAYLHVCCLAYQVYRTGNLVIK